jgi:hypothetical protein
MIHMPFYKGNIPWTKGKHLTQAIKDKISKANKGKKRTIEFRKRMSEMLKKNPRRYWLGKSLPKHVLEAAHNATRGKPSWNKGIPMSKKQRKHLSKIMKIQFKNGRPPPCPKGVKRPEFSKENHPNWKGGQRIGMGYVEIKAYDHPYANKSGYIRRSRLVMEKYLKRYLKHEEIVHHINFDKMDDHIENLKLFINNSEHSKFHSNLRKVVTALPDPTLK